MLYDFIPSTQVLPRAPPGPFQKTVLSNWLSIYEAAQELLVQCFTGPPQFGYVTLRKWYPNPIPHILLHLVLR